MFFKRHELKYYLNDVQVDGLSRSLGTLIGGDEHGDEQGSYLVRSLYFDSVDDECLYEKQSGVLRRQKVRLRTYGTTNDSVYKFEIKHKHGQLVYKESCEVDRELAKRIVAGEHQELLQIGSPVADRIYGIFSMRMYRPKVIVEYLRQAFVFPVSNIRITFDRNLKSSVNNLDIFSGAHGLMPVVLEQKQILEVKFDEFLPGFISKVLSAANLERSAISKYTLARRYYKHRKWEDN